MGRYRDEIVGLATPLADAGDFDVLLDRAGGARVVMLGEASHGTHEFYRWRAAVTQRLIDELGFSFVAVEGDWPDCDRVDRSVRCRPGGSADPLEALEAFDRWPTWMWANEEVVDFCRWLRARNERVDGPARAGFHGLDVYSLWESLREIMLHLREHDPELVPAALAAYRCFEPYGGDPQRYALSTSFVPEGCENAVIDLLVGLRQKAAAQDAARDTAARDAADEFADEDFAAWQNAEVVAGAELYYRTMVHGGPQSWNARDRHMTDTLGRLLGHYGADAKAVVWAHNTHVGDARGSDMAAAGMVTIGQLGRDRHGRDRVVLVGFGCHRGSIVAAPAWGAPMEVMPVPPARRGSLEDAMHDAAPDQALMEFPYAAKLDLLDDWLDHRAIGVVYHPERERWGNYVPTRLGERYDAFCWFDRTRPVRPLHLPRVDTSEPKTYPVGV